MNRCPPGVDSSFFPTPVLPGQRRQRHDPSRSFPVDLRCQHGSTRFTQVGLPLPGPPMFTRVVFDMSKPTGKTPGSSRSIRHHPGPSRWHYGSTPGTPRFTPVHGPGEPGSAGSPVELMQANSGIMLRRKRHLLARCILRTEGQTDRQTEQIKVCCRRRVAAGLTISTLRASATDQIMSSSQLQSVRLRASKIMLAA